MDFKKLLIVGVLCSGSAVATERVVSYDLGSVDTMRALQASDQVVGLPKQALPTYLKAFSAEQYVDVGGLKTPDSQAVKSASPSLILITGRQGDQGKALSEIATTETVGLGSGPFWPAFEEHVQSLAKEIDKQSEATSALASLKQHIADLRTVAQGQTMLSVTHNAGGFSVRKDPIALELLGMQAAQLPESVKAETRGTRTFMPVTAADIAAANPKVVYVVDRSQAIGQADQALDAAAFQKQLKALGASTQVVYLTPDLWYLSGNALESLALQAEELVLPFKS